MNLLALFLCCLTWSACKCAPLQTEVFPMRSGVTSCVGDTVNFTCTIVGAPDIPHRWRITSIPGSATVFADERTDTLGSYEIQAISVNGTVVTESRLSVISSQDLNGESITCSAGAEAQETTVTVFGLPSAPGLMVTPGNDLQSFNFNITPPNPSDCVTNYNVTVTGSDGSVETMTLSASGMGTSGSGFDLCSNTYNFTVVAVTEGRNGAISSSMPLFPGGNSHVSVMLTMAGIEWEAPSSFPMTCFSDYIISIEDNSNKELVVNDSTMISFDDLIAVNFTVCKTITIRVSPVLNGMPVEDSSATLDNVYLDNDKCPPTTTTSDTATETMIPSSTDTELPTSMPTTESTTTPTSPATGTGSNIAPAVGGAVGGVVAVIAVTIVFVLIIVCVVKKKGRSDKDDVKVVCTSSKEPSYHSSGAPPPQMSISLSDAGAAGAMYASPDQIKHEAAGPTGDQYALVTSNTKKKSKQPAPAADTPDVGDMYSVPDKTKKKENQGLVYADIGHQPAPKKGRVVPQQPDNEPVTYATVAV